MHVIIEDRESVNGQPRVRYVEAANRRAALNHVIADRLKVTTLKQGEVIEMLKNGQVFEVAPPTP